MARISFLTDEHIASAVARGLRARGIDALTAGQAALLGSRMRWCLPVRSRTAGSSSRPTRTSCAPAFARRIPRRRPVRLAGSLDWTHDWRGPAPRRGSRCRRDAQPRRVLVESYRGGTDPQGPDPAARPHPRDARCRAYRVRRRRCAERSSALLRRQHSPQNGGATDALPGGTGWSG
jgi:hypothetical protein